MICQFRVGIKAVTNCMHGQRSWSLATKKTSKQSVPVWLHALLTCDHVSVEPVWWLFLLLLLTHHSIARQCTGKFVFHRRQLYTVSAPLDCFVSVFRCCWIDYLVSLCGSLHCEMIAQLIVHAAFICLTARLNYTILYGVIRNVSEEDDSFYVGRVLLENVAKNPEILDFSPH
jgi:hypothetical protein